MIFKLVFAVSLITVMSFVTSQAIQYLKKGASSKMPPGFGKGKGCPKGQQFTSYPTDYCPKPQDPKRMPDSGLKNWFTEEIFNDLFPKSNLGVGQFGCLPFNYKALIIAANYFPLFGMEKPNNGFTSEQNQRRDLAAFFAHTIQETGENDASLYTNLDSTDQADECYYRGGFFNWYEGGPKSSFMPDQGATKDSGAVCTSGGLYCSQSDPSKTLWPCNNEMNGSYFKGCYFGRGALQISYEYNYGQFNDWLKSVGYTDIDLLANPNLVISSTSPPMAMMASLWFYMTPQPPKPSIHDILMGHWRPTDLSLAKNYSGPIFGPSSLIINNECGGEDPGNPGSAGESRRIKAFKWFCKYFGVPVTLPTQSEAVLSCKGNTDAFSTNIGVSYQPDWSMTWKSEPCVCAPASYGGFIPYFQKGYYPQYWVERNFYNTLKCQAALYMKPAAFGLPQDSECLKFPPRT